MKLSSRPRKIIHENSQRPYTIEPNDNELVTQWRLMGVLVVSVIVITAISVSIKPDNIQFVDYEVEPVWNLHTTPYVFDYEAETQKREENLEMYDYPQNIWKVDRRSDISLDEFWDLYDAKWPVLITDVVPQWPAINWTQDYFLQHYGDQRVVMKAVMGGLSDATGHALPLNMFISHLSEASPNMWTYLEDELFLPMRPELKKDIGQNKYTDENFFNLFPKEIRPWDCMLLWGTAYSRSSLHMDPYNWTGTNAVLKGRKQWKLFPPGQDHLLYIHENRKCGFPLECIKYNSPIDTMSVDLTMYPKYKQATYLEVEQLPGEILIIPTGWYHQAFNLEETMAVSSQIMNRNNHLVILEEIIQAGNLKRRRVPPHLTTLLPPDQVKLFMSLLPKTLLKHGRDVTEDVIKQVGTVTNN